MAADITHNTVTILPCLQFFTIEHVSILAPHGEIASNTYVHILQPTCGVGGFRVSVGSLVVSGITAGSLSVSSARTKNQVSLAGLSALDRRLRARCTDWYALITALASSPTRAGGVACCASRPAVRVVSRGVEGGAGAAAVVTDGDVDDRSGDAPVAEPVAAEGGRDTQMGDAAAIELLPPTR